MISGGKLHSAPIPHEWVIKAPDIFVLVFSVPNTATQRTVMLAGVLAAGRLLREHVRSDIYD